jgi:hypothetical protein
MSLTQRTPPSGKNSESNKRQLISSDSDEADYESARKARRFSINQRLRQFSATSCHSSGGSSQSCEMPPPNHEEVSGELHNMSERELLINMNKEQIKTNTKIDLMARNITKTEAVTRGLQRDVLGLSSWVKRLEAAAIAYETESKKTYLVVSGIPESVSDEDLKRYILEIFEKHLKLENVLLDIAYRLSGANPRLVKIRLPLLSHREEVLKASYQLKDTRLNIFINEDLPRSVREAHGILRQAQKEERAKGKVVKVLWSKLKIEIGGVTFALQGRELIQQGGPTITNRVNPPNSLDNLIVKHTSSANPPNNLFVNRTSSANPLNNLIVNDTSSANPFNNLIVNHTSSANPLNNGTV